MLKINNYVEFLGEIEKLRETLIPNPRRWMLVSPKEQPLTGKENPDREPTSPPSFGGRAEG